MCNEGFKVWHEDDPEVVAQISREAVKYAEDHKIEVNFEGNPHLSKHEIERLRGIFRDKLEKGQNAL